MITPQAKRHLIKSDPIMAALIRNHSIDRFQMRENDFRSLVESIISQQLSTKAARTIRERFRKLLGSPRYTHRHILRTSPKQLRAVGLSGSKAEFILGLARAMESKQLNFKKIRKLGDEEIILELIQHKGVGRWTAEMFLIFSLGRPDVFSVGDGGLKNAIIRHYKIKNATPGKLLKIAEKWRPYRSMASLYLWASLDS